VRITKIDQKEKAVSLSLRKNYNTQFIMKITRLQGVSKTCPFMIKYRFVLTEIQYFAIFFTGLS